MMTRTICSIFFAFCAFAIFEENNAQAYSRSRVDTTPPPPSLPPEIALRLLEKFENLESQLATISARLNTLQTTIEQKSNIDDSQCWVRDIVEAIRSIKYKIAEEKLNELNDKTRISKIIHDVYAGSPVNVDIILNFAKSLMNPEYKILVFTALRDEMRSYGNIDPLKFITLVEDLKRETTRIKNEDIKNKALMVVQGGSEDIKIASVTILKSAMLKNAYQNNVEVEKLANAIYNFHTDLSNEVMDRLVESVYGVIAAEKILNDVSSHKSIPQVISGLRAVFDRLNFAGNLNNDATLQLAFHFRNLKQRDHYQNIPQALKNDVEKLIQQLPMCARNLFFSTNVCLWNKGKRQYLYAASSSISYDAERRSIYTWYPGDIPTGGTWLVEKIGNEYFFKNQDYKDEYFYTAIYEYNKDMRYVFNWVAGNNTDSQSAWVIELDNDYCYIKTTHFNEYLFVPSIKYDDLNNYVFTWRPSIPVKTADFQWQVRSCGNSAQG